MEVAPGGHPYKTQIGEKACPRFHRPSVVTLGVGVHCLLCVYRRSTASSHLGKRKKFSMAPSLSLLRCGEVIFLKVKGEMKVRLAVFCYKSRG